MKITSAYANKLLKQLNEDKRYWTGLEDRSYTYTAAANETPVIPDYDYEDVSAKLAEIDEKIRTIKHAISLANVTSKLKVGDKEMTVDSILVAMAQLNSRLSNLNAMRKHLPKSRVGARYSYSRNEDRYCYSPRDRYSSQVGGVPEYEYVNYDLDRVKEDYLKVSQEIMDMQMALDKHNQTFEFEVEL